MIGEMRKPETKEEEDVDHTVKKVRIEETPKVVPLVQEEMVPKKQYDEMIIALTNTVEDLKKHLQEVTSQYKERMYVFDQIDFMCTCVNVI
jgi:hypothetical protein